MKKGEQNMRDMERITKEEKNSILFYQNSINSILLDGMDKQSKELYQIPAAYEVINALLFPGITNEKVRIQDEERCLNPKILEYMPELMKVYCNLYSTICKYTLFYEKRERLYTYRCDRMASLEFLDMGKTVSFTSTSLHADGTWEFQKKKDILLLEFDSPTRVEHVDVRDVLGEDSEYPGENEILFPPFLNLKMKAVDFTENEKKYRDKFGERPKAKFRVSLKEDARHSCELVNHLEMEGLYQKIINSSDVRNAQEIWKNLSQGKEIEECSLKKYSNWKDNIQIYLQKSFSHIKGILITYKR